MKLKWHTLQISEVTIVDANGRIAIGEGANTLRDTIREVVAGGQKKVLLNLAEVNYMDSSGIGELVAVLTAVVNQGGTLKLLNPTKRIHELLQMTHVDKLFQIFTDEPAAVHSFGPA